MQYDNELAGIYNYDAACTDDKQILADKYMCITDTAVCWIVDKYCDRHFHTK